MAVNLRTRTNHTSKTCELELAAQCRAIEGNWDDLLVSDVGRLVEATSGTFVIGQFCSDCPAGRITRIRRAIRCNTCSTSLGQFIRFLDDGPSLELTIDYLRDQYSNVEKYRLREIYAAPKVRTHRAYWVPCRVGGRTMTRLAREGKLCPSCKRSYLIFTPDREGCEFGLACRNPWCDYGLHILYRASGHDVKKAPECRKRPVPDAPSRWLTRIRAILKSKSESRRC